MGWRLPATPFGLGFFHHILFDSDEKFFYRLASTFAAQNQNFATVGGWVDGLPVFTVEVVAACVLGLHQVVSAIAVQNVDAAIAYVFRVCELNVF